MRYIILYSSKSWTKNLAELAMEDATGSPLQAFAEISEVISLLDNLPSVVCDLRSKESAEQQFMGERHCIHTRACLSTPPLIVIFDGYLEQPHLLDPHLGRQ